MDQHPAAELFVVGGDRGPPGEAGRAGGASCRRRRTLGLLVPAEAFTAAGAPTRRGESRKRQRSERREQPVSFRVFGVLRLVGGSRCEGPARGLQITTRLQAKVLPMMSLHDFVGTAASRAGSRASRKALSIPYSFM